MDVGETLEVSDRTQWREWLAANHASADEIWLVLHTKASGIPFVPYDDAVEEALCFGWIDSIIKPLPSGSRVQRYTPRRQGSPVSELNRARVRKLVRDGTMTEAGLANLPDIAAWLDPPPLKVPDDIEEALRRGNAWGRFQDFPEEYRRIRVAYVDQARSRTEEFDRRLANLVSKSQAGKMFGTIV